MNHNNFYDVDIKAMQYCEVWSLNAINFISSNSYFDSWVKQMIESSYLNKFLKKKILLEFRSVCNDPLRVVLVNFRVNLSPFLNFMITRTIGPYKQSYKQRHKRETQRRNTKVFSTSQQLPSIENWNNA